LYGKQMAGIHWVPIYKYCTRPTLATIAGAFCPRQIQAFPQHLEQGRPMFNHKRVMFAVYL
jgi:hypothetical protein